MRITKLFAIISMSCIIYSCATTTDSPVQNKRKLNDILSVMIRTIDQVDNINESYKFQHDMEFCNVYNEICVLKSKDKDACEQKLHQCAKDAYTRWTNIKKAKGWK